MSSKEKTVEGVSDYKHAAGGWGALKAIAIVVKDQMDAFDATKTLLKSNQPQGFDCPGCAWPDKNHKSTFQFCENGAKAVAWEATSKRATPEIFSQHSVSELLTWNDHDLENLGRLTHPLQYDATQDKYVAVSWEDAFASIATNLNQFNAEQVDFYASGRTSNEAAFLYQLFARQFGNNNFPDCSNMCHEATSVGLVHSIGQGKGTVSLEDFDKCDLILSFGHNPGTNHPRMMGDLHKASLRGVPIVTFNPLLERSLERFIDPQSPKEMLTMKGANISSDYLQVRANGDASAIKGIIKALFELEHQQNQDGKAKSDIIDYAFINEHTTGFDDLKTSIEQLDWKDIEADSGLSKNQLEKVANLYSQSKATILTYGMGITQHTNGIENVQLLCNLLFLRGNIGKEGAGLCPLRGHSNVQGNRTVGITEIPSAEFLQKLGEYFNFTPPSQHGRAAAHTLEAIMSGECKGIICLGGNLPTAMPDHLQAFPAMRTLDLSVHIATKLNRSHLLVAKQTFLLPCLGRTEQDRQNGKLQSITVEDSMSMVHASSGSLPPASGFLRSEVDIIANIANATLKNSEVDWLSLAADNAKIRDAIEAIFPGFENYNQRIMTPGGFRLPLPACDRVWRTTSGKANFSKIIEIANTEKDYLNLISIRSHDQFNTTIYSYNDRYRGISGRRDVLFMNKEDMDSRNLAQGDKVTVCYQNSAGSTTPVLEQRQLELTVIDYPISKGSVAAYYPESNVLIPLSHRDLNSGTPAYKSIPVVVNLIQD